MADVKKDDECLLGLDPARCPHQKACRYWVSWNRKCAYRAVKEQERKQRLADTFDDYDTSENVMRINK